MIRILQMLLTGCLALALAACSPSADQPVVEKAKPMKDERSTDAKAPTLGALAERFVHLTLEIGELEPGYVDAYYGPAEWSEAARGAHRDQPALAGAADALAEQISTLDRSVLTPADQRRWAFLAAQTRAAQTRLKMLGGETLSFADEAQGLFAVRPVSEPLTSFDSLLAEIEELAPGKGELADRVDALIATTAIPADRLDAVMQAAIAECRRRTAEYIDLPDNESFQLEFVTDKPWSGYNWYQGKSHSLIQINTDLPVLLSRAVDLGCHEGYPGHHVLNLLLEQRLTDALGYIEFSIYPLYSPLSLIAEGSANFGIDLAFPDDQRLIFERDVLYPLAGLDPANAERDRALLRAKSGLTAARITIAQQLLDGEISREEAVSLTRRYQLVSAERAEQSTRFTETYRSYVINYGLGESMVATHINATGVDQATRWAAMERLLTEPTLPADLQADSASSAQAR